MKYGTSGIYGIQWNVMNYVYCFYWCIVDVLIEWIGYVVGFCV